MESARVGSGIEDRPNDHRRNGVHEKTRLKTEPRLVPLESTYAAPGGPASSYPMMKVLEVLWRE